MTFRPLSALVLCENRLVGRPFLLCLLAISSAFAADPIERYLNAPFASELIAAPGGGKGGGRRELGRGKVGDPSKREAAVALLRTAIVDAMGNAA